MTELFGIDLRCIGRQGLNMDFGMIRQVGFCQLATWERERSQMRMKRPPMQRRNCSRPWISFSELTEPAKHFLKILPLMVSPARQEISRRYFPIRFKCGVSPQGAQVGPTGSVNEMPNSSANTISASSRCAFFYPRPILAQPGSDQLLIPFKRTGFRPLHAPTQVMQ